MGEYIFIGGWEYVFIGGWVEIFGGMHTPIPLDLYPCVFIKLANQLENKYNIKVRERSHMTSAAEGGGFRNADGC